MLRKFCEVHGDSITEHRVREECRYDKEFQPLTVSQGYGAAVDEAVEKRIRQIDAKSFHYNATKLKNRCVQSIVLLTPDKRTLPKNLVLFIY